MTSLIESLMRVRWGSDERPMGVRERPDGKSDVKNLPTSIMGIPSAQMGCPMWPGRTTVKPPAGCEGYLTRQQAAIQLGLRSEFKIRQFERGGRLHAVRGRMGTAFYPEAEVLALRAEFDCTPRPSPGRWTDADLIALLRQPTPSGRLRTAVDLVTEAKNQHRPRRAGVPLLVQTRRDLGYARNQRATAGRASPPGIRRAHRQANGGALLAWPTTGSSALCGTPTRASAPRHFAKLSRGKPAGLAGGGPSREGLARPSEASVGRG